MRATQQTNRLTQHHQAYVACSSLHLPINQESEAESARLAESLEAASARAATAEVEAGTLRSCVADLEVVARSHGSLMEEHRVALARIEALEVASQASGRVKLKKECLG